jgi:hypothetical protein
VVTDAGPPVRRELASIDQYSTDETVTLEASEIVWSDVEAKFTNPANEYEFSSRVFLYYKGMTPAPIQGNAVEGEAIGTMSAEGSISFFNYVVTDAGPPVRRELASIDQYSTDETVTLEASEIVWSDVEAKFTNPANEYEFSSRVFLYYDGLYTPPAGPAYGNAVKGEAIGTMNEDGSISFFNYVVTDPGPPVRRELASIDQYSTEESVPLESSWPAVEAALNDSANKFEFSSRVFLYYDGLYTPPAGPAYGNAVKGEAIGTMNEDGSISFFNYVVTDPGPPVRRELASIDQYSTEESVPLESSWPAVEAALNDSANKFEFSSRVFLYYDGLYTPPAGPAYGNAVKGEAIGTMNEDGSISFFNYVVTDPGPPVRRELASIDQYSTEESVPLESSWPAVEAALNDSANKFEFSSRVFLYYDGLYTPPAGPAYGNAVKGEAIGTMNEDGSISFFNYVVTDPGPPVRRELASIDQYSTEESVPLESSWPR